MMTDNREEEKMTKTLVSTPDPEEPKEPDSVPPIIIPHDNRLHEQCCDKRFCGAQIMVLIKNAEGKLLAFCQHHYNENEPALVGQGFMRVQFVRGNDGPVN
jgi:hypothetical protein